MGVTGVGGSEMNVFPTGVHGRIFTGVSGGSGSSTVNVRLNGHSVFSNLSTFSRTSRNNSALRMFSSPATGTSILQYCGRRI
jgi:hypothetical protein